MSVRDNMKKISEYDSIVAMAYRGNDADRFRALSREFKLLSVDLINDSNKKLYSEFRRDIMTVGVGCISLIEDHFGYLWGAGLPLSELDCNQFDNRERWEEARRDMFDRINIILNKYKELLLDE